MKKKRYIIAFFIIHVSTKIQVLLNVNYFKLVNATLALNIR